MGISRTNCARVPSFYTEDQLGASMEIVPVTCFLLSPFDDPRIQEIRAQFCLRAYHQFTILSASLVGSGSTVLPHNNACCTALLGQVRAAVFAEVLAPRCLLDTYSQGMRSVLSCFLLPSLSSCCQHFALEDPDQVLSNSVWALCPTYSHITTALRDP